MKHPVALGALVALATSVAACGEEEPQRRAQLDQRETSLARTGDEAIATTSGLVSGARSGATVAFRGIPYAAPPVGALRWRAPEPATAWAGVRKATEYGAPCPQMKAGKRVGSEDCLTLNVWTPAGGKRAALPVLVFLHGGGNILGSSGDENVGAHNYDGQLLASAGPAVVVTLNYRLGTLGFLAHPAFAAESRSNAAGNYGLMDQVAALKWVNANISAFGGDPSHVLLFGQSGGARDTCMMVVSPLARGLFSSALVLSGGCKTTRREAGAFAAGAAASRLGCAAATDVAACLRSRPLDSVVDLPATFGASPAIFPTEGDPPPDPSMKYPIADGYVIPDAALAMLQRGEHNHMPIVMSTTRDEDALLVSTEYGLGSVADESGYEQAVQRLYGARASLVLAQYPPSAFPSVHDALVTLLGDASYVCPTRQALRAVSRSQREPVYRAVFSHPFSSGPLAGRAPHGIDYYFGFHVPLLPGFGGAPLSAPEIALADQVSGYWVRLARTGDPNGGGAPAWPAYGPDDVALDLDIPISTTGPVRQATCDFWDGLR